MKMKLLSLAILSLVLVNIVSAQSRAKKPDLLGSWKCSSEGLLLGDGSHAIAPTETPTAVGKNMLYVFESQEGNKVFGTKTSDKHSEPVLGIISFNNRSVELVDEDGYITWSIIDKKRATAIYRKASPTALVIIRSRCRKQKE
jgi:hypothetical protein